MKDIPGLTGEEAAKQVDLFGSALILWAKGRRDESISCLVELSERSSEITVLFMLGNWIVQNLDRPEGAEFAALEAIDARTGRAVNPDSISPNRESPEAGMVWASRFIVATLNGDREQQHALIDSTESWQQASTNMTAMLIIAGEEMKRQLDDMEGE